MHCKSDDKNIGCSVEVTIMSQLLSPSAEKVQEVLKEFDIKCQVIELPGSTRTANDAASAVGCRVEQIAKSVLFQGRNSGKPVMVIASGSNRVNEKIRS